MRYTKYQYKKNNKGTNFISSIIMMIVGAGAIGLVVGTIIFNTVWSGKGINTSDTSSETSSTQVPTKEVYTTVQCGYFSKEENANKVLESLGKSYNSFISKEDDKFRVLAGVFTEEDGDAVVADLKSKGIESAKIKFTLNEEDKVEGQISAIADGYFKIVSTLKDSEVKSLSTTEFKVWAKELPEITEGEKKEAVNEFKNHIEQLPSDLKKENLTDELKYIYTILIKFKK
ncbi:MAG: SPOR domain-containing protein [Clostridium sp.]